MAKAGDKKRIEENAAHLRKLQILILIANVAWLFVRFVLRRSSLAWTAYAGLALTSAIYLFCYSAVAKALAPHFAPGGEILYSGADLKQGGVLSYYHDLLYLAIFAQLGGVITWWAWLAFLAVPGYVLYYLATNVLLPYWNAPKMPTEGFESEADRRRREKKERQASRQQKFMR